MNILAAILSPRVIVAIAAVLALAMGGRWCWVQGAKGVQVEWDADIAQRTAQALDASEAARATEQALQNRVGRIDRAYQDQKRATATVAAAAGVGMRELQSALAGPAAAASATATARADDAARARIVVGACAKTVQGMAALLDERNQQLVGLQEYVRATARP